MELGELAIQLMVNGLALSFIYCLISIGLTMIYGVMHILNWAHGEFVMLGAYVVWLLYGRYETNFAIALLLSMVAMACLAIMVERIVFKPMRGLHLPSFIMSLGLVYVLQASATAIWGAQDKVVPVLIEGSVELFGAILPSNKLIIIPIAALLTVIYYIFLEKTKWGRGIRASSQDEIGASAQGISINLCAALAMATGVAIAGAAGGLLSTFYRVHPAIGGPLTWKAFIIVFLGGRLSLVGTVMASLLIGMLEAFVSTVFEPRWVLMIEMSIFAFVLVVRPGGLVGREVTQLGAARD